jgi:hypothetical protein
MIALKIGDKKVRLAQGWHEVTLGQGIRISGLKDSSDVVEMIAAVTGLESDYCARIRFGDVEGLLYPVMSWMAEPMDSDTLLKQSPPDSFVLGGQTYRSKISPGDMIYAQHLNLEALVSNTDLRDIDKVAPAIAICCQRPDKYSEERQKVLEQFAMELPMFEAFAIAGFFFRQYQDSLKRRSYRDQLNIHRSRLGQALKTLKDSVFSTRSIRSRVVTYSNGIKS